MNPPTLTLGALRPLDGSGAALPFSLPASHLTTHAVVLGMTGSGKTGLLTVLVEEALRARVPVLLVDVKGDLADLALTLSPTTPEAFLPWLSPEDAQPPEALAAQLCEERRRGLAAWGLDDAAVADFNARTALRILTPGSDAGEPLHVLSALERRSPLWDSAPDEARAALSSAVSLVLRLLGRDADPARSREHVLLSVLAERRLRAGSDCELGALLREVETPPVSAVGAMEVDEFLAPSERHELAAALNGLLASPSFTAWRRGASLDVGAWMSPREGRTSATLVSVAHLPETERTLVLGVLLDAVLAWVHTLPGASKLRALVVFDEVYGFLPPHPANPPTKRPLVSLLKQGRAFGVGCVLATQNPMDLDYRALSNAGLWFLGRLQTDADRARVVEGLAGADGGAGLPKGALASVLKRMAPRWFVARNARAGEGAALLHPRYALSWLRGPLTTAELRRRAREVHGECAAG